MSAGRYPVWDGPTRVVHWAIVLGVALQYLSGELDLLPMQWHYFTGYALLALLLFRLAWGFAGSESARFRQFVRGPGALVAYVRELRAHAPGARPGHNPVGGWSTLVLLALLLVQGVTGLFASDDILEAGPLADTASASLVATMTSIHHAGQRVLLAFVAIHVVAVGWHAAFGREDLVRAMFDGRKSLPSDPALRFAGWARALVVFAASAGLVAVVVRYA